MNTDHDKLLQKLREFTKAMQKRLDDKCREGFSGWDDNNDFNDWDMPERMANKVTQILLEQEKCQPKDLVDIANFAMFLYSKHPLILKGGER